MSNSYSIRESLRGGLQDYIESSNFRDCTETAKLILDLTGLLAFYREEDTALFPSVFVFSDVAHIPSLAPATWWVPIGVGMLGQLSAESILKSCAPLAEGGWAVYVAKEGRSSKIQYGLFRSKNHAIATSAEEAMAGLADVPILRLRNRGPMTVELKNTKSATFTVSLTPDPAAASPFDAHIQSLARGICEAIDEKHKGLCETTICHLLSEAIERCHGTLCAVVAGSSAEVNATSYFSKSVWLSEPLRWSEAVVIASTSQTAEALANLQALHTLVKGMINSDGVVVFGDDGTVRGYRAILTPTDIESAALPTVGGARRRAHALMCKRLGLQLRVAFFRSQDGKTLCEKAS